MNYVAHQYLSFGNTELQIGNLYGEVVRGKDYLTLQSGIQKGVLLHRRIDSFTDSHPIVKSSCNRFYPRYGKYAPVIVDVMYDYLLIKHWKNYSDQSFEDFVNECYELFRKNFESFPSRLQFIVQHLLKYDWFHNYATLEGVSKTLYGIGQRSKFPNEIGTAVEEISEYENEFQKEFEQFFPELIAECRNFIEI